MTTAVMEAPQAATPRGKTKAGISMPIATLIKALAKVMPAVERKTTIPVLSSVLFRSAAENESAGLQIVATDLDLGIQVTIPASTVPAFAAELPSFILPGHKLSEYVKLLDGKAIDLSLTPDDRKVTLKSGRSTTKFAVLAASNFPNTQFPAISAGVTLSQSVLQRMLTYVTFALTEEESRYVLHGALLEVAADSIRLVATDGHRMAMYTVSKEVAAEATSMLLPTDLLKGLAKVMEPGDENVTFESRDSEIGVSVEQDYPLSLTVRKLAGQFPNYRAVVPPKYEATLVVNAPAFHAALQRCATAVDSRSSCIKLTISPESIPIRGADAETAEAEDAVDAKSDRTFEKFSVGFQAEYLIDVARRVDGDVQLLMPKLDGQSPIMFSAAPAEDEHFECIVMPMRI